MVIDNRTIQDQLTQILDKLNTMGMQGRAGALSTWPVIIRRNDYNQENSYGYNYPSDFFRGLQREYRLNFIITKKNDRLTLAKLIIDKLIAKEIDIFLYHFGMYLIYYNSYQESKMNDELTELQIGKKRYQFMKDLPQARFLSTDDFLSATWVYLIQTWETSDREYRKAPLTKNVRVLFTPDQFAEWTGRYYSNADWLEPIAGDLDLKCHKWLKEKDPMTPVSTLPEGWVEGQIILGHKGPGNYRHFVQGVPVYAGAGIFVKFGDGWISGRYEWSFDGKSLIQIHHNDDVFYINEGHIVRVRA